jgi:hypothetical protein
MSARRWARLARGLAVCPLCCDEAIIRPRCWLCFGLGFVPRELRNRYKRGLVKPGDWRR